MIQSGHGVSATDAVGVSVDIAAPGRALTRLSCLARSICTAQGSQCC